MLVIFALGGYLLNVLSKYFRSVKNPARSTGLRHQSAFDENSVIVPKGLYYDRTHTWAFMEQDGLVRIGIDDFLQHITGPVTKVIMKKEGEKIRKGDILLTIIQKGKQLNILAPVTGIVSAFNPALASDPSILHSAPYQEGWVYKIEPANWMRDTQFLAMAESYRNWLKSEFTRLKDFLAGISNLATPSMAHVVLQDGGSLKESVLADFGPEVWEDFQTKFINNTQ